MVQLVSMSNDNNENHDSNDIQRRDFLKKSSLAAGAGFFGLSGFSGDVDAAAKADFDITGRSQLSDAEARSYVGDAMSWSYTRDLSKKMIQDAGLQPAFSNAFGVSFTTDDPEVNAENPAAVSLPYVSPQGDRAGLLVMTVADTDEGRAPLAAFGVTAEGAVSGGDVQAMSAAQVKTYAVVDEQATVVRDRQVSAGEVGAQGSISCGACEFIVGELCSYGVGKVTEGYCIEICLPLAGGIYTYIACAGACALIIDYLTEQACSIGSTYVCEQAGLC